MEREKRIVDMILKTGFANATIIHSDSFFEHALLEWVEEKVVRDGLGRFAKKVTETASSIGAAVGETATNVGRAVARTATDAYNGALDLIGINNNDPVGEFMPTGNAEADGILAWLFALAGGLPGWVLYKLIEAFKGGTFTRADISELFSGGGSLDISLSEKIAIIDELIAKEQESWPEEPYSSLDELPEMPIQSLEEVLAEDHFAVTDWDDPGMRVGNCTLSTLAYELRRRGYDVEAMDLENGTDMQIYSYTGGPDGSPGQFDLQTKNSMTTYDMYNASVDDIESFSSASDMLNYIRANPSEFPSGSRGFLEMQGHIQNYEVDSNGDVVWVDGQAGGGGEGNLGRDTPSPQVYASPPLNLMRTDDKEINPRYLAGVRESSDTYTALAYVRAELMAQNSSGREKRELETTLDYYHANGADQYYVDIVKDKLDELER